MQVDDYFTRTWEFDLKFTGIENPRLVYQMFGNNSDIEDTRKAEDENKDLLSYLKRKIYKRQTSLIRFFYNLKVYLQDKE